LTKTRDRCSNVNKHGTDGQTDRQSATQYAAPSYGGGPHNNNTVHKIVIQFQSSADNAVVPCRRLDGT